MKITFSNSIRLKGFSWEKIHSRPEPEKVLFVSPDFYDVKYVINPHMKGNIEKVNKENAKLQWKAAKNAYGSLGLNIIEMSGKENFPDMVFCANQSFPLVHKGKKIAVMSRMATEERKGEVNAFENFYKKNNYEIFLLSPEVKSFEGMGDALWHSKKYLLYGGYGFRTDKKAYDEISEKFDLPVVLLKLINPLFYHLDTCFCPLDEKTILIYREAFTDEGIRMIGKLFKDIIYADANEAEKLFCCNAHCPDGKNVLIQKGCSKTIRELRKRNFNVIELDTSEFLKAGGSVYCMKMMMY